MSYLPAEQNKIMEAFATGSKTWHELAEIVNPEVLPSVISRMIDRKKIKRIGHGLYDLPNRPDPKNLPPIDIEIEIEW